MVKLTVTVDDETAQRLRSLAERKRKPQSLIVREAIAHYESNPPEHLTSPAERARLLRVIDEIISRPADKDPDGTRRELAELHESRRAPHRLPPAE